MIKQMYTLCWQCDVRRDNRNYLVSLAARTAHSTRAFVVWLDIDKADFDAAPKTIQALFMAEMFGKLQAGLEEGMQVPPAPADVPCHPAFANRRAQP